MAGLSGIDAVLLKDNGYIPLSGAVDRTADTGFSKIMENALEKVKQAGIQKKVEIKTRDDQVLYEKCQELETFIVKTLTKGMRQTVTKSGLIDTGIAGEIYEDMLWDKYSEEYARSADFGLAEQAYLELNGRRNIQY